MNVRPGLIVRTDYEGYFAKLVTSWIDRKEASGDPFVHTTITVSAGPYRSSAVTTTSRAGNLHLDFYSALRTGFGSLSAEDVTNIVALL